MSHLTLIKNEPVKTIHDFLAENGLLARVHEIIDVSAPHLANRIRMEPREISILNKEVLTEPYGMLAMVMVYDNTHEGGEYWRNVESEWLKEIGMTKEECFDTYCRIIMNKIKRG